MAHSVDPDEVAHYDLPYLDSCCLQMYLFSVLAFYVLTHCILIDSSTVICWTSPFVILEMSALFCGFYSYFDRKYC